MTLAARVRAAAQITGHFLLRSGRTATDYFDKYRLEADPELLADIAAALVPLIPPGTDAFAGLELGGVPVATALSLATGLPVRFVRKQAKPYGTRALAEGGPVEGLHLLVVEDVVTTGGQVAASAAQLRERGATVTHALCIIDREEGGAASLAAVGVELVPLLRRDDLAACGGAGA